MKNWKTTLIGAVGAALAFVAQQYGVSPAIVTAIISATIGALGLASKDSNVTGGSVQQ